MRGRARRPEPGVWGTPSPRTSGFNATSAREPCLAHCQMPKATDGTESRPVLVFQIGLHVAERNFKELPGSRPRVVASAEGCGTGRVARGERLQAQGRACLQAAVTPRAKDVTSAPFTFCKMAVVTKTSQHSASCAACSE